jgi:5'-nucleotidase
MTQPLILLTNDDGVHSPGLLAAAQAVCQLGSLVIVAPKVQQSSMGRAMPPSTSGAMFVETILVDGCPVSAYSLPGSPAQSVLYAVIDLLDDPPDLVISGINFGENLGTSTTVSGTVGAALQAGEFGIPALAVSLETSKDSHNDPHYSAQADWSAAAYFTCLFARTVLSRRLPDDVDVLKIDVPATATPETPWRMTRQSRLPYYLSHPTGRRDLSHPQPMDYAIVVDSERLERDTDTYAFAVDRVVSVTPLSLDLTSRVDLVDLAQLLADGV